MRLRRKWRNSAVGAREQTAERLDRSCDVAGAAAQASAARFSPDQQNGATPEERSRIGENHAMIQKDA